jgi:predicted enzyme related to lactoylglutathione lyase
MRHDPHSPISHIEWRSPAPARCAAFLEALFGWQFQPHGNRYLEYCTDSLCLGLMEENSPPPPGACQAYLRVTDLDRLLARVTALNGSVALPARDIPGYGRYARLATPDGTVIGLFESQHPPRHND